MINKHIISFCLYGSNPKYCIGAVKNAQLSLKIYPGWDCWFYCGNDVPDDTIDILSSFSHVKIIHINKNDPTLMFDRFLAITHDDCDIMIVRDCDSRLSARELSAVSEWLNTDYSVHLMRDHPYHNRAWLGGMWGAKKGFCSDFINLLNQFPKRPEWQSDQDFLNDVIWPKISNNCLQHDSYYRHIWGGKPFPSQRIGKAFVGEIFDENDMPNLEHRNLIF